MHSKPSYASSVKLQFDRILPKGSFRLNVGILAGGTALSQAVVILTSPILTRIYSAEDLGYLQIYLSISVFLIGIASLRYETAILLPKEEYVAANVLAVSLSAVALLSALCMVVTCTLLLTGFFAAAELRVCIALLAVSMCAAASYQVMVSWFLRKDGYQHIARTKFQQILVTLTIQLSLGALGCGVIGLLVGDVLGKSTGIWRLVSLALRDDRQLFAKISWYEMRNAAIRYSRFPLIATFSTFVNTAGYAAPMLLIAGWYGPTVTGWLGLTERVTLAPAALIGCSVTQVYSATLAKLAQGHPESLQGLFTRTAKMLFAIGLCVGVVFAVGGPVLFSFLFGESWKEAGEYARLYSGVIVAVFVTGGLTQTLNILERQSLQLLWDILRLVVTCGVMYGVYLSHCSARSAIFAYSLALIVTYSALFLMSYVAIRQHASTALGATAKNR